MGTRLILITVSILPGHSRQAMRTGTFISACFYVLMAMWVPAVASGSFLAGPSRGDRNKVKQAQRELQHTENEVRNSLLAVERERNYTEGTNRTLAKLQTSLGRAKKERRKARKVLAEAKKKTVKKHKN